MVSRNVVQFPETGDFQSRAEDQDWGSGWNTRLAQKETGRCGEPKKDRTAPECPPRELVLFFQNEFLRIFPTGAALSPASASRLSFQEQELLSF